MPSPICEVKDGAGAFTSTVGGVDVTPTNTVTIRLASAAGVNTWSIQCITTDELSSASTVTSSLVIDQVAKTATFTAPAAGRAYRFKSTINNGVGPDGVALSSYSTTFCVYTPISSRRVHAVDETYESDPVFGWLGDFNDLVRTGGGASPTGTGFRHVTSGTEDAAAKLVENADVATGAAIAVSKLAASGTNKNVLCTVAGAAAWSTVDLSSSDAVSGTLPVARGGTGLTAAGTNGNVLITTAGAPAWGTVNLASSDAVSGALAAANGGTGLSALGTALHVLRVNAAGTALEYVAATSIVASSGATNTIQTSNGSSGFSGATNVLAGTDYISIGTNPSTTGALRLANNVWVAARNPGNSADLNMMSVDSSSRLQMWGATGSYGNAVLNLHGSASFNIETSRMYVTPSNIRCGLPLSGLSDASSAFKMKGIAVDCSAGGTITATAAQYECPMITLTGTPAGPFNYELPNQSEAWNNVKNATAQDATIRRPGGTGFVLAAGSTRIAYHRGGDYEAR